MRKAEMETIPRKASLAYRAPLLARLVRLGAPESIVANEIAFVVQAGYLEYGHTMRERLARFGLGVGDGEPTVNYTRRGRRVRDALNDLEASKRSGDRQRIVCWSGILVQAASDLANEYLTEEAQDIAIEKMTAKGE
jgi:hypothetical protein